MVRADTREQTEDTDNDARWNLLQRRIQHLRTLQAVEVFRSRGIEPLVIKGVAAARYYPPDRGRASVDVDLAVAAADHARALSIVEAGECPGVGVDVHRELRHLDTLPWTDLFANSVNLQIDDSHVRVLRPEDDLRVLCVHWLTDGGVYKDRLWDIYYAVERRSADFDWQRFLDAAGPRRRRWFECMLGIAAKYLGLNLDGTPVEGADDRVPDWMIQTIEEEWAAEIKPVPLEASLFDRSMLMAQVKRRMRPNPIFATIDCEGSIDARTRLIYQVRNWFRRIPSSIHRISRTLKARRPWRRQRSS